MLWLSVVVVCCGCVLWLCVVVVFVSVFVVMFVIVCWLRFGRRRRA